MKSIIVLELPKVIWSVELSKDGQKAIPLENVRSRNLDNLFWSYSSSFATFEMIPTSRPH